MSRMTWKINPSRRRPGWLLVLGPFDQAFKEALKERIPANARSWDDVLRGWFVHEDHRAEIERIIEEYSEP